MNRRRSLTITPCARTALSALVVLGLGATACGDDDATDTTTSTTAAEPAGNPDDERTEEDIEDSFDDTAFESTSITGRELVPGSKVRLEFTDGQLSASAGCNTLGGAYELDGDRLVIEGELRSTQMACDAPLMEQDTWLSTWLVDGPTFVLDGWTLTLTGGEIAMELTAVTPGTNGTVQGSWQLDTVITGDTASSVPAEVETPTLEITGDQMQVFTGCNRGGATVQITDTTLTFEPVRLTRMACPEPAMELEASVVAVLDGEVPYELEGELLNLGDDDAGLVWRRSP